jgi:uncharacterized protein YrrD
MAKTEVETEVVEEVAAAEATAEVVDYTTVPGTHVLSTDGQLLGTYADAEAAQAFIDGHVTPQGLTATIVEGPAAE